MRPTVTARLPSGPLTRLAAGLLLSAFLASFSASCASKAPRKAPVDPTSAADGADNGGPSPDSLPAAAPPFPDADDSAGSSRADSGSLPLPLAGAGPNAPG